MRVRAVRIAIVACALAGAGLGLRLRADAAACDGADARIRAIAYSGFGARPADVADVRAHCRRPAQISVLAAQLAPVAPAAARELAGEARRKAPDTFATWAGETIALQRSDPAAARAAWERAKALNPRWTTPRP